MFFSLIPANSLTVVWEQSELDHCFSVEDLQFSVCDYFLQRGSCYQNKTGENHVETIGDKYYRIQFHDLKPCQSHQVSYNSKLLFQHSSLSDFASVRPAGLDHTSSFNHVLSSECFIRLLL